MLKKSNKPKSKNLIILIIFLLFSIILNLPFFLMKNSIIEYNLYMLLLVHILLPIVYGVIICLIFSYLLFELESLLNKLKDNVQIRMLNIISNLEACVGIFFIFFAIYLLGITQEKEQFDILSQTIYFKILPTNEDDFGLYYYWVLIFILTLFAYSVLMFFASSRQTKIIRQIKSQEKELQYKNGINQHLGFDYENCEFYNQVKIPYSYLRQTDGTRGEFEVYHMLRNSGLTQVKYIFNREIPKSDALTTELDLIIIHNKGIFVIENKHYTTRIFGNAVDHDLTIIDRNGNKKSIYNPIKQNENHVLALKEFLSTKSLYIDDETTPIHSIVVFTAEDGDKTDDIISGISTSGTETKVCTSQNVYYVVERLISNSNPKANINIFETDKLLSELPIRKKYS